MNILLDTNAFYSYYGSNSLGLSENLLISKGKLDTILKDPNNIVYLTNETIIELIVRFRNEPKKVRNLLLFYKKNIRTRINDKFIAIDESDIDQLLSCSDENIKIHAKKFLKKRISVESKYASLFIFIIIMCFLIYYAYSEGNQDLDILSYYNINKGDFFKDNRTSIKNALRLGYANENQDRESKNIFNELLTVDCEHAILAYQVLNKGKKTKSITEIENEIINIITTNNEIKKLGDNKKHATKIIARMVRGFNDYFDGIKKEPWIDVVSNDMINMLLTKGFGNMQSGYFSYLLVKWLDNGAKIEKNDIFDFFIMGALDKPDLYFITFDKKMQTYISSINHISRSIISKVYK